MDPKRSPWGFPSQKGLKTKDIQSWGHPEEDQTSSESDSEGEYDSPTRTYPRTAKKSEHKQVLVKEDEEEDNHFKPQALKFKGDLKTVSDSSQKTQRKQPSRLTKRVSSTKPEEKILKKEEKKLVKKLAKKMDKVKL
eukprot:TRINITY_DN2053_c0_g1_i1.p1 TRINITY_DN2053_c0_g1~~TRINITY_DN2053_c0_g1_i1.p1  ORF type:complete len:137 (-),score=43.19 TRINITY_DN2053_c0_g1_i1:57-467(-)